MQGVFWKAAFLEILGSLLLTGVAGSQYTFCNATKNELQTKCFETYRKLRGSEASDKSFSCSNEMNLHILADGFIAVLAKLANGYLLCCLSFQYV